MKTRILLLTIAVMTVALASCRINYNAVMGSGKVVSETREVSGFSELVFAGAGDVTITQGETESLTIEAEDNVLPRITTQVQNGKLTIGFDSKQPVNPTRPIRFNLSVKNLDSIALTGAGNILVSNLKAERFSMQLSGAGNMKINGLEASQVAVSSSGAGNFDVSGKADKQDVTLTGFGNYNAANLESQTSKVMISGAGTATVWANTNLDVRVSGAGSVGYYGNAVAQRTISGAGTVNKLGTK
jgi:hypothetical protein